MTLKDTAERAAVLGALHDAIGAELKTAKAQLQDGLRQARKETGAQQIGMDLDGQAIGKVTLVQPKAAAVVVDETALLAWVREVAASEITSRVVTEIRPAWLKVLLAQVSAAECAEWADPETGVIHEVPGVELQYRLAYTRMTVPAEGKQVIAQAWRDGRLAHVVRPELLGGDE